MTRRSPRLARWILERVLPPDVREGISGDLDEMFRRRSGLWYWRQALSFSTHFTRERLRGWRRRTDMTTGMSWLDFKLGVRMLRRYPGLTFVGGLGMAVAIAVGVTSFAFFYSSMHPVLPLAEGDRIVGLENWDTSWNNQEERIIHDFVAWRSELKSVEDLAAFRQVQRNMIGDGQPVEQVSVGEMTASAFRLARVSPVLGRPLIESDERKGAAEVVVIGYTVWKNRFASRTSVIGESVRLGATVHTIVGVMPEGFAFPASERAWVPLRADPLDYERRRGPGIMVAGRLAPGATFETAQAELTTLGTRMATAFPKTHDRLRPRVVRYTEMWFDDERRSDLNILQIFIRPQGRAWGRPWPDPARHLLPRRRAARVRGCRRRAARHLDRPRVERRLHGRAVGGAAPRRVGVHDERRPARGPRSRPARPAHPADAGAERRLTLT